MILFLTVALLSLYILTLFYGRLFPQLREDLAKLEIKNQRFGGGQVPDTDLATRSLLYLLLFALPVIFIQLFLISVGLSHDPYFYPSAAMLALYITSFVITFIKNKKKKDLTVEINAQKYLDKAKKQHTFGNKFVAVIYIAYFVYLLWMFVG